ncbi:hypothetical protein [Pseudomonas savastanoi]|uniref:hypothetical protein n=2 Tax=Pseudomonas savastanoi TaxID=29438 RepID=UPI00155DA551|nr:MULTISPECIES: hypothetical protein [Pseudomonas syringae group genomosp. 2]
MDDSYAAVGPLARFVISFFCRREFRELNQQCLVALGDVFHYCQSDVFTHAPCRYEVHAPGLIGRAMADLFLNVSEGLAFVWG